MSGPVILLLVLLIATLLLWTYSTGWGKRPAIVLTIAIGLLLLAWAAWLLPTAGSLINGSSATLRFAGVVSLPAFTGLE